MGALVRDGKRALRSLRLAPRSFCGWHPDIELPRTEEEKARAKNQLWEYLNNQPQLHFSSLVNFMAKENFDSFRLQRIELRKSYR